MISPATPFEITRQAHEALDKAASRAAASRRRTPAPALSAESRARWEVEIRDAVIQHGHTEDGEENLLPVFVVNLVNEYGERFQFHKDFFELAKAERFARRRRWRTGPPPGKARSGPRGTRSTGRCTTNTATRRGPRWPGS